MHSSLHVRSHVRSGAVGDRGGEVNLDAPNFTDGPLSTAQAEGTSQAPQEETGMDRGRLLIAASMINNEQFSKLEFELRMSSKSYGRKTFW